VRIAVNGAIIGDRPSGLGFFAMNLVRELSGMCEDLTVYTSAEIEGLKGVKRIPRIVRPDRGVRGHALRMLWTQTELPRLLMRDSADVLLNPLPEGPLGARVPMVTVVHDLTPLRFPAEHSRQQWNFRRLVPALLGRTRRIAADSEATKSDIVSFYSIDEAKISVVPAGYDDAVFTTDGESWSLPPEAAERFGVRRYILYVGNLRPHKNLHRLVRAFRDTWKEFETCLVIVGHGDARHAASLKSAAENAPILFIDYVASDILPSMYRGAAAFVFPSLWEGFGLPPLEAMACGTPVVLSEAPALVEVAGEAAEYFDPLCNEAIVRALRTVLGQDARRNELREKGLQRAKLFSWQRTAEMIFNEVRRAAAGEDA